MSLSPEAQGRPVPCEGFLAEGNGACILVGGAGSCLSEGQCLTQWFVLGVFCEVAMALGSMSANGYCCVLVLLVFLCEASSTGVCWTLGSAKS